VDLNILMIYLFLLGTIGFAALAFYFYQKLKQSEMSLSQLKSQSNKLEYEQKKLRQYYSKYDELILKEAFSQKLDEEIDIKKSQKSKLYYEQEQLELQILKLKQVLQALEEQDNLQAVAFYQSKYDFSESAEFQNRLEIIRFKQKNLINSQTAIWHCLDKSWDKLDFSNKDKKIHEKSRKLLLRAFNSECDAAISKIKYNNVNTQENRINKAYEALNKLSDFEITWEYLQLKLEELHLSHEYQEKKQQEIEEQRRIREQMKEEEQAIREIEKAKIDAEKDEQRYQKALEKARLEIDQATGKQYDRLEAQIQLLTQQLEEASINKERAISRAQITKSGHVYIISNIGAFGEDIYKIGMTRRLDPMDRVNELGDASVPFPFDVHAIIFCENAPELENLLHRRFHHRRVNKINERKEFFRVGLDEIANAVKEIAKENNSIQNEILITKSAAAIDYRKTIAMLEQTYQDNTETIDI